MSGMSNRSYMNNMSLFRDKIGKKRSSSDTKNDINKDI